MSKKTILIIEDEPHIVLGLKDALEFEGYDVLAAYTGKEGVAIARAQKPDAVLLDLMLPDINGYQVCEELRRFDPFLPVIMLTARSQEADKIRGLDAGADDYVTKPFSVAELTARIRAIVRRASRSPGAPRTWPARRSRSATWRSTRRRTASSPAASRLSWGRPSSACSSSS